MLFEARSMKIKSLSTIKKKIAELNNQRNQLHRDTWGFKILKAQLDILNWTIGFGGEIK